MLHKMVGTDTDTLDRLIQDVDFRLGALDAIKVRLQYIRDNAVSLDELEIALAVVTELNIGSRYERAVFAEMMAREYMIEELPTEGGDENDDEA